MLCKASKSWRDLENVSMRTCTLLGASQIASPAGPRPGFERASPVCPVLAQSGQSTGFICLHWLRCNSLAQVLYSAPYIFFFNILFGGLYKCYGLAFIIEFT